MKKIIALFVLVLLSACQPSPKVLSASIQSTIASIPTETAYPTYTAMPSYTPNPTYTSYPSLTPVSTQTARVVVVTATSSPTPQFTPTETLPPTATIPPTATFDATMADKGEGFYLVGSDIAPGVWRSTGEDDSCYWGITTKTGDIISNHFGMAGGTMYIPSSAFQVQLDDECGQWKYMGQ